MAFPIKDCSCEDFPCCKHADNYPAEPDYCNVCGYNYYGPVCKFCEEDYDEDYEDEIDEEEIISNNLP